MMDCTDRHDRFFLRLMSKNVMLYTEMVATKSAIHGDRKKILSYRVFYYIFVLYMRQTAPWD